MPKDEIVV